MKRIKYLMCYSCQNTFVSMLKYKSSLKCCNTDGTMFRVLYLCFSGVLLTAAKVILVWLVYGVFCFGYEEFGWRTRLVSAMTVMCRVDVKL